MCRVDIPDSIVKLALSCERAAPLAAPPVSASSGEAYGLEALLVHIPSYYATVAQKQAQVQGIVEDVAYQIVRCGDRADDRLWWRGRSLCTCTGL
jgi:hypothetical protein